MVSENFEKLKFWTQWKVTLSTTNNRTLIYGSFHHRRELFVVEFIKEFEIRLHFYDLILRGEIEKTRGIFPCHTKEFLSVVGEVGGALWGIIFDLLKSPLDAGMSATNAFENSESGKEALEFLAEVGHAYMHDNKRKRYANILQDIITLHKEKNVDLREILLSAALDIFRSFEFQLVKVNNNKKWEEGIIDLAKDAAHRSINYYVNNYKDTNINHEEMISKGVIFGKSKNRPIYVKPRLSYRDELGKELRWTSESLYENTGITVEEKGYYKKQTDNVEKYGFRRLLHTEHWNTIKDKYIPVLSEKNNENNRFRNYEYKFQDLNDEEKKRILSKIPSNYHHVTEKNRKEIFQELKDHLSNENQSNEGKNPEVLKICQQIENNMEKSLKELQERIQFDVHAPVYVFTGRKNELNNLHKLIKSDQERNIIMTVLHGRAGIGKTQLARQYIKKFGQNYANIVWINCESQSHLYYSFEKLAEDELDLKKYSCFEEEKIKFLNQIYEKLSNKDTLIIFDNAENEKWFHDFLPHAINPNDKKMHVLIISKNQKWGESTKDFLAFELLKFALEDEIRLVKKGLNITDISQDRNIYKLLKKIDHLPLCIMQAISYINNRKCETSEYTISNYPCEFDEMFRNLSDSQLFQDLANDQSRKTAYTIWVMTTEKIGNDPSSGELALKIFYTMSYLAPQNIKTKMFLSLADNDQGKLETAVGLLAKYSLINPCKADYGIENHELPTTLHGDEGKLDEVIFQIHRTVQDITRLYVKEKNKEDEVIGNTFNVLKEFMVLTEADVFDYDKIHEVLPHFEAFLNQIRGRFTENPNKKDVKIYSNVVKFLAIGYADLGYPIILKDIQEEERVIKEKYYGHNHYEVAVTLTNLGNTYGFLGDVQTAKVMLERAKTIHEKQEAPDSYQVAVTLRNLGIAYGCLSDLENAIKALEKALDIEKEYYSSDHYQLAITLTNLGHAYADLGYFQKAKESLEKALNIEEKHYGQDHYQIAMTLTDIGIAYGSLGEVREEKEFLERALHINKKYYGPDHYQVAITLRNLGIAYGSLGDVQNEIELLEKALDINKKHYGTDHFEVAITLRNLGNAYLALGNIKKAKELLEKALNIKEKHYGPNHYQVAITLECLGYSYREAGDVIKAKKVLEKAIVIFETNFGPDHYISSVLEIIGVLYGDLGDIRKKCDYLERALSMKENYYGLEHYELCFSLENLGIAYGDLGDNNQKIKLLNKVLSIKEKHYGSDHYELGFPLENLGVAYGASGNIDKEIELLKKALAIKENHYGADHYQLAFCLENLGLAFGELDNVPKKVSLLKQVLSIKEKHYGVNHYQLGPTLYNLAVAYDTLSDIKKRDKFLAKALNYF